ncbi:hypothetical protein JYP51_22140 [Ponticoccus gilvus]|nr:hypothetical protein [Enemella evansiae]
MPLRFVGRKAAFHAIGFDRAIRCQLTKVQLTEGLPVDTELLCGAHDAVGGTAGPQDLISRKINRRATLLTREAERTSLFSYPLRVDAVKFRESGIAMTLPKLLAQQHVEVKAEMLKRLDEVGTTDLPRDFSSTVD